jgi:hypothetical protein
MKKLLAVDLGLRTGLALFNEDGRLVWYRSQNFGTIARLRRGVYGLLAGLPDLAVVVVEGGGQLAVVWEREAERLKIRLVTVSAEQWREQLLLPRERRTGRGAKDNAGERAREVIAWSGIASRKSLRHDAAEAILVGLWGVLAVGWMEKLPDDLRR